jgi:general secretion pathway protein G
MRRPGRENIDGGHLGFTLIELLIVVAIIGIIAAVAIPNLMNAIDKGKQKRSMADMRQIATAVESYGVDYSKYPSSIAAWSTLKPLLNPFFIKNPPDVDGWDGTWDTTTDATGGTYTISSLGKLGVAGSRAGQWPQGTQQ